MLESFGDRVNAPILPESFLGESTRFLRSLWLLGIPFPALGKLLLCTHNHVELHFPHSGYISHEAMAIALYRSTRPESGSNHLLLDSDSPDLGLTENVDFCPS